MIRSRNFLLLVAVLVGAAVLGSPSRAQADIQIAVQTAGFMGGARTVVASGPDFTSATVLTNTYGDFTVTLFTGSSTNGVTLSDLLNSSVSVTNNSDSDATIKLWVTQKGYTLPATPVLFLDSGLGGSVNDGELELEGIFQAYADKNNNEFGTGDFTNGPQDGIPSGSTFATGTARGVFTRNPTAYSLTSEVTLTLSGGATANYSSTVSVTQAVPAPAGVLLALTGLPFLGLGTWLRRRKARLQKS